MNKVVVLEPDSAFELPALRPRILGGPLGDLPKLDRPRVHIERAIRRLSLVRKGSTVFSELFDFPISVGEPEFLWRPSGLKRPNLVAQLISTLFASRIGIGIEISLAHVIVDRILGFDRLEAERKLQLTPVEWGIWTFLLAKILSRSSEAGFPPSLSTFCLDRVGPDPFDLRGLEPLITVRWPVTVGDLDGSIRLWLPESSAERLMGEWSLPPAEVAPLRSKLGGLTGVWRAEAGTVNMNRGLGRLRVGGIVPLLERPFGGTPKDPRGTITLMLETARDGRFWYDVEPVPNTGAGRVIVRSPLQMTPAPREALAVSSSPTPPSSPSPAPTAAAQGPALTPGDVPVTLVVELGRVNLSLGRLADLKPGDVVELGRHSREPVELTSAGRLVARGELVQIDTELGVRITNVFM